MQSKVIFSLALVGTMALSSCSKLGELSADNFTVTPSPLEAAGGKVPVKINGRFPEKYMKRKAVVKVTPVLRYAGGQALGQAATFQGEKVQGNDQEISYKLGGNYSMKQSFAYVPAMQRSELYLTFDAQLGSKKVNVPDVKVADGVVATSSLLSRTVTEGNAEVAPDAYQYAIKQTQKAQIKYLVNQASVRNSELQQTSIQDFVKTLRAIKADQKGFMLENIEVAAYASPEGSLKFNTALAEKRQKSSSDYVGKQLKNAQLSAEVEKRYTAEDWDGFKELVGASNIQDKDVILRILSMYNDPEEREKQIRNLSAGFTELADEILPELRRARLQINYNVIGRSDDEIEAQYQQDPSQLSVEELLYAATLTEDVARQKAIYETTAQQYPNDYRAFNNLAALAYAQGDLAAAKSYLAQATAKKADTPETSVNQALLALAEGDDAAAETYLMKGVTAKNYRETLGNLMIARGQYASACEAFDGVNTNSAALAQILNKDYAKATHTLKMVARPTATTSYLKAIVAARMSQDAAALTNLKEAIAKDASFKTYASKDLEFVALFNDSAFQNLVK